MSNEKSPRPPNRLLNLKKYLLECVGLLHSYSHRYFGCFLDLSSHQEFIQEEVSLLKVENDVQLAHLKHNNIQSITNKLLFLYQWYEG